MIASIYVLIDTVSFYMFWYFYVELWSLVNREQRFCTLYKSASFVKDKISSSTS